MKTRFFAALLALTAVAALLAGCGGADSGGSPSPSTEAAKDIDVYYSAAQYSGAGEDGAFCRERRSFQASDEMAYSVLESFFSGPESEDAIMPFPKNVSVSSAVLSDDGLFYIELSDEASQLEGIDRSIAEYCLVLTLTQVEGVTRVQLSFNQEKSQPLTADDVLLRDTAGDETSEESMVLYFADGQNRYLLADSRRMVAGENLSIERYMLEQLIKGPTLAGYAPTMPEGTRVLSVTVSDGLCTVDLSSEFYENRPATQLGERMSVYSIVNTLTGLDSVDSVRLLIEGRQYEVYRYIRIGEALEFYPAVLGPVSANERDLDLYVKSWSEDYLALVPCRVERSVEMIQEELALSSLIAFEAGNGYESPVPLDTEILSVEVDENICYVDLNAEFYAQLAENPTGQRLCVNSIVSTLCALDTVDGVVLLSEGEPAAIAGYGPGETISASADMLYP